VAALPARPVERPHAVGAHLARVIGGPAAEWGRLVMPARIPRRGCDRKVAGAGFAVRLTAADRSRQSYSARSASGVERAARAGSVNFEAKHQREGLWIVSPSATIGCWDSRFDAFFDGLKNTGAAGAGGCGETDERLVRMCVPVKSTNPGSQKSGLSACGTSVSSLE
jgi:hypothetical protein